MSATPDPPRRPNPRGRGELLREEIITAAVRMLDERGNDEALSLRAVARTVSIAATSVYLHFPDRDALVFAAMQRCHDELVRAADEAEAAEPDPTEALRARTLAEVDWAQRHPGLYKVLHESGVNRRGGMPFKEVLLARTTAAVRRCMAADADAGTVALDLRAAVHGMLSLRVNEPGRTWPPVAEQVDRFLTRLVGVRWGKR